MKYNTVRELLDISVQKYGENVAYVEKDSRNQEVSYNFRRLKSDVDGLLCALNAMGLRGKHIGLWGANTYCWIVAYLAVLCGLGVVVPIPAETSPEELKRLVTTARIDLILADDRLAEAFSGETPVIPLSRVDELAEEGRKRMDAGDDACETVKASPDDFCKIIFTSGTTGARRGVMLSQRNMMCIVSSRFVPYVGKVSVSFLPLSHAFESVCHILTMIALGGKMILCTSLRAYPPCVAASGAECLFMVPSLAEAFLTRFRPFLNKAENLKRIVCGGAPIPRALVDEYRKIGIALMAGYGLSECAPLVSLDIQDAPGSVGVLGEYCQARISPDGEIQVKGENVMLGYYQNEEATRAAFTEDGWLRTGDIGHLDEKGNLYLTGRIKNLIILSNGENVSPEELETLAVNRVPGAQDALCSAENDLLSMTLYMGGDVSEETLSRVRAVLAEINDGLPAYKRVQKLTLTPDPIPVSATGKKIRKL